MGFVLTLFLWAAFFILSEVLRPKPQSEQSRPASLGDFKFPTATEERVVPLIWGTVKAEGPNVVWYGNLQQVPITKEVKTGLFSSDDVTTGFRYYLGVQMALCRGPSVSLLRIWIGDQVVFTGNVNADGSTASINSPNLFGGDELGTGGVIATVRLFTGSTSQTASTYLSTYQQQGGDTPAYRGTCYVVAEDAYLGNTTNIQPWKFELQRLPNGLGMAQPGVNSNKDAHIPNVLYEAMTDTDWGLGFPPSDIDTTSFIAAATTLATEGNGFSFLLDKQMQLTDLMKELERQMDGVVFLDRATGRWKINLARGGYTVGALTSADPTNVVEVQDFTRGAWQDTTNQVRIQYVDRSKDYFGTYALAQDMANIRLQGNVNVSITSQYPGVMDGALATNLAWRDLRGLSYPLAKATLVVDRTFYDKNCGDVIRWNDDDLGIVDLPMRITRVDLGRLVQGQITLNVVQDIYRFDTAAFSAPVVSGWVAPSGVPTDIPAGSRVIFEAPRAFTTRDPNSPGVLDRIWVGCRAGGTGGVSFDTYTRPNAGNYTKAGHVAGFLLLGQVATGIPATQTQGSATLSISPNPDALTSIFNAFSELTANDIGVNLSGILLIDNEICAFKTATNSGTTVDLAAGYRGLLDTAQAAHSAGANVWLLFVKGNLTKTPYNPGDTINVKPVPKNRFGQLAVTSATATNVTMANRGRRPYCPTNLTLNASAWSSAPSLDNQTGGTLDTRGLATGFTRRDYRTTNEVAAAVDETSLPADFPTANTTQYRVEVRNDPAGANTLLFNTAFNAGTASVFLPRTKILRNTAGALPTTLRVTVQTQHVDTGVTYPAQQNLVWDFGPTSPLLSGDFNMGVLPVSTSGASFSAPSTGTYTINIGTALSSGNVEVSVAGGAFAPVVTAGSTTGTFVAVAAQAVVIRHTQSGANTSETFCELVFGGTSAAYAILTY